MGFLGGKAVTVVDFWNALQSNPSAGKTPVIRLTHVKNLDSSLAHEYLQLIIVNDKGRERIVVERSKPDRFIFNGEWKMPKIKEHWDPLNSEGTDLPLPLYSLEWDQDKAPNLSQITDICKAVHDSAPDYNILLGKHCYWYALLVYQTTKRAYYGHEKEWPFHTARGKPAFPAFEWFYSSKLKVDAAAFQTDRATHMNWVESGDPDPSKASKGMIKSLETTLKESEVKKESVQELATPEESVKTSIVDELGVQTTPYKGPPPPPAELSVTTILEEYDEVIKMTDEDPNAAEYVKIAREAELAYVNKDRAPSDPLMMPTSWNQYGYWDLTTRSLEMDRATDVMIGKVLQQIGVTPKVEPPSDGPSQDEGSTADAV
ncbi:hypothetical protein PIIN_07873 [Serendipita indica DSM 11827]|uniref:Uncharacterized protein n=1 Tax=Serendipita indica (strain DSM 11827) TaxID=1109443 RepID=G4TRH3_SERID|nr:hypothetical protein PIIN_07873 [Serendipita indica DSM 11827]